MRKWLPMLLASTFVLVAAPASQASPLLPAGTLAGIAAANETVLVGHKHKHFKKHANRGRHLGWRIGRHKGWAHSRHRQH